MSPDPEQGSAGPESKALFGGVTVFDGLAEALEEVADHGGAAEYLQQCYQQCHSHSGADNAAKPGEQAAHKRAPDLATGGVQDVDVIQDECIFDSFAEALVVDFGFAQVRAVVEH